MPTLVVQGGHRVLRDPTRGEAPRRRVQVPGDHYACVPRPPWPTRCAPGSLASSRARCEHTFVSTEATILHADLDAFYASVEQRDDPRLRGRPVIVGGGVVLAASYEAKACGVRTAMGARRRGGCARTRSSCRPRMAAYSDASKAVFEVFDDTTPLVEGLSIDEAFLDVRGMRRIAGIARGDRRAAAARRARAGRPADHRRRRAHEVPREGRERRREAGRAARRPARPRARVPAPAAGRAALGRRPGDRREAARARHHDRRRGRGACRRRAGLDRRPGVGRHLHALAHNRDPRPRAAAAAAAVDGRAAGDGPRPLPRGRRHRRSARRARRPRDPPDARTPAASAAR